MSHYKPYTAYKESGVGWIEPIPKHWDIVRIKRFTTLNTARTSEARDNIPYIGLEDVESGSGKYAPTESNSRQSDTSTVGVFSKGQVLYGKLRPYLRKAIITDFDGVCSTEFLALQPDRVLPELLQNWLLSPHVTQQIESTCEGAKMPRADWEGIGNILMPLPPVEEQIVIRDRTRAEASRIDTLISKKARFIELLKEKRQTLITHAVTKGLNSDVKMKDSGVEWIGEIPVHWKVKPMKYVVSCNDDLLPESTEPQTKIRYVDISSVTYEEGIYSAAEMLFLDAPSRARRKANYGDVIVSTVRTYLKAVASINEKYSDCIFSTGFAVLRSRPEELNSKFLKWLVLNELFIQAVEAHSEGLSYPAINAPVLISLKVAVPPMDEQMEISLEIDKETSRIDNLINKTQKSIDLLRERRSAFVTAAVTGQIDLRGEPG